MLSFLSARGIRGCAALALFSRTSERAKLRGYPHHEMSMPSKPFAFATQVLSAAVLSARVEVAMQARPVDDRRRRVQNNTAPSVEMLAAAALTCCVVAYSLTRAVVGRRVFAELAP